MCEKTTFESKWNALSSIYENWIENLRHANSPLEVEFA
jgi:hypothetical protein